MDREQRPATIVHAGLAHPAYRPDIDGLRAVAVLIVVAFHAFPRYAGGGYIGVDIFFVISGYLITGLIFDEMREGRFSILRFYARRARRIFPALIVVCLATFIGGWLILSPKAMQSLGMSLIGSASFSQNLVLLKESGYFDIASELKPLLHIWSLGIEEQFYIGWPLILILAWRWQLNVLSLLVLLIIASFAYNIVILPRHPELAFYSPFSRSWELLIGALLALASRDDRITSFFSKYGARADAVLQPVVWTPGTPRRGNLTHDFAAAAGLGLIAYGFVRFNNHDPYPGFRALVPVAASALLILSSCSVINRHILSSRVAVQIGLISYPFYLWHFPLMAYARTVMVDGIRFYIMGLICLAALVLAWLTYQLLEKPVRRRTGSRLLVAVLFVGMAGVGVLGVRAVQSSGFPERIPEMLRPFMLTGEETSQHWRQGQCLLLPDQSEASFTPACAGNGKRPLVMVWGDSYGAALFAGLNVRSASRNFDVAEYTASSCPPLIGFVYPDRRFCHDINDFVIARIAELRPDVVIFYSTWSYNYQVLGSGLQETVARLKALQIKKIILLGPPATWKGDGLSANVLDYYWQYFSLMPLRTMYRSNNEWTVAVDKWLAAEAAKLGISFISARDILCNDEGCLARIGQNGSDLTAYDTGHLTLPGSLFVTDAILDEVLRPVP